MKRWLLLLTLLLGFAGHAADVSLITVPAGANLQNAINGAGCRSILLLASGATWMGHFTLPKKGCAPGEILIRTDIPDASLPASDQRIRDSDFPALAKIVSPDYSPAIQLASGAGGYTLLALEISVLPTAKFSYGIIFAGANQETSAADWPHDFTIDRCYVHGSPKGSVKNGTLLNGPNMTVKNSVYRDFHMVQQDSQALSAWASSGPLTITNNELEAAGEVILFGGSDPRVVGAIASDFSIMGNWLHKRLAWMKGDPSYDGSLWQVKNLLEFKCARRGIVQGNILEYNWAQAQVGFAALFTPRDQNGTASACEVSDIDFGLNIIRHSGSGIEVAGADGVHPSLPSARIHIHDNLLEDIDRKYGNADGRLFEIVNGGPNRTLAPPASITFSHNTGFASGAILSIGDSQTSTSKIPGFVFTSNIAAHNKPGVSGGGVGQGSAALAAYFASPIMIGNIFEALPAGITPRMYPDGNYFPADWPSVKFSDLANGIYSLDASSPYHMLGADGADPGVNWPALMAATKNTLSGQGSASK